MLIRIGTRRSPLAQAQARWVVGQLQLHHPGLEIELAYITTSGDRDTEKKQDAPPHLPIVASAPTPLSNLKAAFTKEIEEALLEKKIDIAVHSMKDLAVEMPKGLMIGAVPLREDPWDVWVSKNGSAFKDLPKEAKIGTGSIRRAVQIKHYRTDLQILPLRGNVETRLRKLTEGSYDGIVLALAGMKRLGLNTFTEVLPREIMLPAVGQGALAIQIREGEDSISQLISSLNHRDSQLAITAERTFLKAMGGTCQTPMAAYADIQKSILTIQGVMSSREGSHYRSTVCSGPCEDAEAIGMRLALNLQKLS